MKANACTIHSVLLPSSNFFPKNSSWVGLDKFGFLGGGVATQLEDITSFRGTKKKGLEYWKTLCNCVRTWRFSIQSATNCC